MSSENPLFRDMPGGERGMSAEAVALLCGVTTEEMRAEFDRQRTEQDGTANFSMTMPADWLRNGRRRAREASAVLETDDITKIVHHLRNERDGGAAFRKVPQ